ncbi:MAG: hypothetical protein JJU05_02400 [Verrucomicrobia bacterium]|nr:hypothetical protein [Verrucomicrobiota bacterium]MCH8526919.1 hypothetical protein [Kiritimatiellia bacterium]
MPVPLYQTMSLAQRAALDRALEMTNRGGEGRNRSEQQIHQNAANEWERFRAQHGDQVDPEIFAYTFLMQALSQRGAHDRHTAVRTFTEVLDFFPEEVWLAAPTLYFRARTHFDIGDDRRGFSDLRDLIEHEQYQEHVLAADAMNRIAANHWENARSAEAVGLWSRVAETFAEQDRSAGREAENRLQDWALVQGAFDEALDLQRERENRGPEARRDSQAVLRVFEEGVREMHRRYPGWYFHRMHEEEAGNVLRDERRTALYAWFLGRQSEFFEAERLWDFLLARFDYEARFQPESLDDLLTELSAYLRSHESDSDRQKRYADDLIGRLASRDLWDSAYSLLVFFRDPAERLWKEFAISERRRTHEHSLDVLVRIDALEDPEMSRRALRERAGLLHQRLNRYEEAIELYYQINDPPDTLWRIVDCHRRAEQREEARRVLTEIASIFPDQAARAVFTQAEHHRADGEEDAAVTLYLRVLRHPEWTRTQEASRSHDRLEAMGHDTAGGVIHDVH